MAPPTGFTYALRKNGEVVISHNGREAAVLRGAKASKFVADVSTSDEQIIMARVTGNYRRGNERRASSHSRNRS